MVINITTVGKGFDPKLSSEWMMDVVGWGQKLSVFLETEPTVPSLGAVVYLYIMAARSSTLRVDAFLFHEGSLNESPSVTEQH